MLDVFDISNLSAEQIARLGGKFSLGQVVATPGAFEAASGKAIGQALGKHFRGEWGDCCEEDKASNEEALVHGRRVMSVWPISEGSEDKFWIITEADRSVTTVLLPEEY